MRRGDVGHVEGRVLAHQHDVEPGEVELLELAEAVMIAVAAEHFERPAAGIETAIAQGQRLRQVVVQRMAARLREGRIRVDVDRVDRIHLDRDGETHLSSSADAVQARIVIALPGPSKPNSPTSTSRPIAMQPAVGEKSGRATCRKIALPRPGATGSML